MYLFIKLLKDPKDGPRLFLSLLAITFLWIAFCQGINANLWGEVPRFDRPASTYEEIK